MRNVSARLESPLGLRTRPFNSPFRIPNSAFHFHPRRLASATTTAAAPSSPSRSVFTTTS